MSDLSDFGGGIEAEATDQPADADDGGFGSGKYSYRTGRCKAITNDGQRCSAPTGYGKDCCHTHQISERAVTIDDGPRELIEATTRTLWRNFENELVREAVAEIGEESA